MTFQGGGGGYKKYRGRYKTISGRHLSTKSSHGSAHRRTGRGGRGGKLPPKKITKSKSRANVQHKSGEEWEIKKPKSQKAPSLLGKQRQSGNIRFTVGQYWLIIKRTGTNYVNFVVNLVMYGKGV